MAFSVRFSVFFAAMFARFLAVSAQSTPRTRAVSASSAPRSRATPASSDPRLPRHFGQLCAALARDVEQRSNTLTGDVGKLTAAFGTRLQAVADFFAYGAQHRAARRGADRQRRRHRLGCTPSRPSPAPPQ